MEVHAAGDPPTEAERAAIDGALGVVADSIHAPMAPGEALHTAVGGHVRRAERHRLLPALHAVNDRVGWISRGAVNHLAARLDAGPADIYGVATFYALFSTSPRPRRQVHVCTDLVCRMAGSPTAADDDHGSGPIVASPCLGACERAPVALVVEAGEPARQTLLAPATGTAIAAAAAGDRRALGDAPVAAAAPQLARPGADDLALLGRIGRVDPVSLDDYRATGGYEALRRAFALGPAGVVEEVTAAGLVGRGGAAFPTGRKWAAVAAQPTRPHHLVANADESEPGTFKDRVLLEGDPFALLEAMTIAALATGCERGWVYLRGEYPRARHTLEAALDSARRRGLLGDDILGTGFAFDVEVVRGAGAYICGEETAIFNSIEGSRGEPRNKPPFPTEVGLFGRPTVVNNVETLVNVPVILRDGAESFAAGGAPGGTGRKLFCVTGAVAEPGVYEVPFGVTLGDLLALAGGVPGGDVQAVLLGGAAGAFVGPEDLDVPLAPDAVRQRGASLGSGAVVVLDRSVDLADPLQRIAAFFRDESCGQCVPCRIGTVRQEEALARLVAGGATADPAGDVALLRDVAEVMRDASICGLGQTAANAVLSAIDRLGWRGARHR